jgi:hypothetical protein
MILMLEDFDLASPTPHHLETLAAIATGPLAKQIESSGGRLMAAWLCNAEALFRVTQVVAFQDPGAFLAYRQAGKKEVLTELESIAPRRNAQLFVAAGAALQESFERAIAASQRAEAKKKHTLALLDVVADRLAELVQRNEGGVKMGLPLVTTLTPLTGPYNRVINIWKGDLNEPGYQPPAFYESIGFGQAWWAWIREVAPRERLLTVSMLPHSPLQ